MLSTAKLLEYLCRENRPISAILNDIPKAYLTKLEIRCPANLKGRIMRSVIEDTGDNPVELIDGVKIYYKKDWVLVLPHADSPSIIVEAEASDENAAKKLLDMYVTKIRDVCAKEGGKI